MWARVRGLLPCCFPAPDRGVTSVTTAGARCPHDQQTPSVDFARLNSAIDQICTDLIDQYMQSELVTGRNAAYQAVERRVLESTIRHHIALGLALALPYILPAVQTSMVCTTAPPPRR